MTIQTKSHEVNSNMKNWLHNELNEIMPGSLKGKFSSGIEGALASTLNRDIN